MKRPTEEFRCSFCDKPQSKVKKLVSSPSRHPRAYICDACVAVCVRIMGEDLEERTHTPSGPHIHGARSWWSRLFPRATTQSV